MKPSNQWYSLVVKAEVGYSDALKSIEEDWEYAKNGVYTERDSNGAVAFRVNLNNGSIFDISREVLLSRPDIHFGRQLPPEEVEKFRQRNQANLEHYEKRLQALPGAFDPNEVVRHELDASRTLDELSSKPEVVVNSIKKLGLHTQNEQYHARIEALINAQDLSSKFIAGVVQCLELLRSGGRIHEIEARSLANQIANYEFYGRYHGNKHENSHGGSYLPASLDSNQVVQHKTEEIYSRMRVIAESIINEI